ncbi:MAG TPA: hypothetical protein VGG13_02070 [Candidatus Saccharimonadales bacterium]
MKFKIFVSVMLVIIAASTATTAGVLVYGGIKVKSQTKTVTDKVNNLNGQIDGINKNLQNINKSLQSTNTQLKNQSGNISSL